MEQLSQGYGGICNTEGEGRVFGGRVDSGRLAPRLEKLPDFVRQEHASIRDWDNRTKYDEGMNNIRKAFMLPGFVEALDQNQTEQEKWTTRT